MKTWNTNAARPLDYKAKVRDLTTIFGASTMKLTELMESLNSIENGTLTLTIEAQNVLYAHMDILHAATLRYWQTMADFRQSVRATKRWGQVKDN